MAAINNLKGHIVKDGKVIYSEQLENGLHFVVILMYEPFYEGKNANNYQMSSRLICEALITTGNKHTYSNGTISLEEASTLEKIKENEKWKSLCTDLSTKDGFRVYQKDYQYNDYEKEEEGKKIKLKTRRVTWLVEVPKLELLRICGHY